MKKRPALALTLLIALAAAALSARPARAQDDQAMTHVTRAVAAEADENWRLALQEYSAASSIDTSSTYLVARVIRCLFHLGRDDEVMSFTNALWRRDSTQAEAAGYAAEMARLHGRMDEAALWFAAAARANPGDASNWIRLGEVLEVALAYERAEQAFARASEADPESPGPLFHLAWLKARAGRESEAREPLERLVRLEPSYRFALIMLGRLNEKDGRLDDARQSYARAAQVGATAEDREEGLRGVARVAFVQGRFDDALPPLSDLIRAHPREAQLRALRMEARARGQHPAGVLAELDTLRGLEPDNPDWASLRAELLLDQGKGDRAGEELRAFAQKHPGSARAQQIAASLALRRGRWDEALAEADRARALAPDSARVHYLRGQILAGAGRRPEAETALLEATRLDSTFEAAYFALGVIREKDGHLDSSEQAFRAVLRLNPKNASALNYVGYMYADRGLRLEQSLDEIGQALAIEPDNPAFLDSKGWTLFRLGRMEEARDALKSAVAKGGQDAVIHEHLGDVLCSLRRYDEAREAYLAALEKDHANRSVRAKLKSLRHLAP